MLCLARIDEGETLTIPQISSLEGMTQSHVAKLLAILRKAGFINSTRGQLGGYSLAMSSDKIQIKSLLEALGGKLFEDDFCNRYTGIEQKCVHENDCAMRPLWLNVQAAVDDVVSKFTLSDLVNRKISDPPIRIRTNSESSR